MKKYCSLNIIILIIVYLAIPVFEIKLVFLGLAITFLLWSMPNQFTITRKTQQFFLFLIFSLSYIVVPNWLAKPLMSSVLLGLALFLLAYVSQTNQGITITKNNDLYKIFAILFLVHTALNYLPMTNSIGYMGDESAHMSITKYLGLYLLQSFKPNPIFVLIIILLIGFFAVSYFASKRRLFLWLFASCFAVIGVINIYYNLMEMGIWTIRYPILIYYFKLFFSFSNFPLFGKQYIYQEGLYRILPFMSMLGVGTFVALSLKNGSYIIRILVGISVLTVPSLVYYSSLTYIEPTVIFLVVIAILLYEEEIFRFVDKDQIPMSVFLLTFVSFIKETTIVYMFAFFCSTALLIMFKSQKTILQKFIKLLQYGVLIFGPVLIYLYFRPSYIRPYRASLPDLFVLNNYKILLLSLWEQFGLLFPLSIMALGYLLLKKKYMTCFLSTIIILSYTIFFTLDDYYISRFDLYVFPGMLGLFVAGINEVQKNASKYLYVAVPLIIIINLTLSPINFLNGARKPTWGDGGKFENEYCFPYNDLYRWISEQQGIRNICIVGRDWGYMADTFYKEKYNLKIDQIITKGIVHENFFSKSFDLCVYHKNPYRYIPVQFSEKYQLIKKFQRMDLELLVYREKR